MPPPVNLQLAAACLKDMPLPSAAGQAGEATSRSIPDPDVSEWSGLLVNEQEVAVQAVGLCMASSGNAIELTPLWPKNQTSSASPIHKGHSGSGAAWPADHKAKNGRGAAPQPPPLPSSCPPAVPTKSKNQPPPAPPPLPATSSREYRKQQESRNRLAVSFEAAAGDSKGPAPPPPVLHLPNSAITSQPLR